MQTATQDATPDRRRHEVWEVYDELRTARLNTKYYSCVLDRRVTQNFWVEFTLAASASAGVAGAWVFSSPQGQLAWKILGSVSAVLAVYRAVAGLSEEIRKLERRVTAYRELEFAWEAVCRRVRAERAYSRASKRLFEAALEQKQRLITSYVDPKPRRTIVERCYREVQTELPADSFYIPSEIEEHKNGFKPAGTPTA